MDLNSRYAVLLRHISLGMCAATDGGEGAAAAGEDLRRRLLMLLLLLLLSLSAGRHNLYRPHLFPWVTDSAAIKTREHF